jgi:DNA-binding MarR family transcriptional regulator
MDLDLRKLRYFVAVADLLHFGRAAAALYITQPALSRQIRQFEEELGVELLERSSRQVSLTPAGKRLAEDGARLLADSEAAVARAALHRAGDGDRRLLVPVVRFRRLDRLSAPLCSVLSAPRHARDHRVLRLTSMHHLPVGKPRPRRDRPARSRRGITDHRCHGTARPARRGAAYDGLVRSRLAEEPSGLSVGLGGFVLHATTIASRCPGAHP